MPEPKKYSIPSIVSEPPGWARWLFRTLTKPLTDMQVIQKRRDTFERKRKRRGAAHVVESFTGQSDATN